MSVILEHDKVYHVFSRGNNKENLFNTNDDFHHFMQLYSIYIQPIAHTYAWCLMRNHFHFCIRIKEENSIGYLDKSNSKYQDLKLKWRFYNDIKTVTSNHFKPSPNTQLNHFLNAYATWYNVRHNRTGSLFQKNCNKKPVEDLSYLTQLIVYINMNPVKHGFVNFTGDYTWSSFTEVNNGIYHFCDKDIITQLFVDKENFNYLHSTKFDDDIDWGDFE